MDRAEHREAVQELLKVEEPRADGVRWVTLAGVVMGKLRQDPDTGKWLYEVRSHSKGWIPGVTELEQPEAELAELWAVEEVAAMLAIEREAMDLHE